MSRSAQYYAVYQQALKNLQGPFPNMEDEVIVALWKSVQTLQTANTQLNLKMSLLEEYEEPDINTSANALLQQFKLGTIVAPVTKPTT